MELGWVVRDCLQPACSSRRGCMTGSAPCHNFVDRALHGAKARCKAELPRKPGARQPQARGVRDKQLCLHTLLQYGAVRLTTFSCLQRLVACNAEGAPVRGLTGAALSLHVHQPLAAVISLLHLAQHRTLLGC